MRKKKKLNKKLYQIKKSIVSFFRKLSRSPFILASIIAVIVIIVVICIIASTPKKNYEESYINTEDTANSLDSTKWVNNEGRMYYDDGISTSITGIDVSEWDYDIDWNQVKASGIEFAIIRVGYRGYETGAFVIDTNLQTNLKGATDAGIQVGVYFVSQAIDEDEAIEEAEIIIKNIQGYKLSMPIYFDCEAAGGEARTDNLTASEYTAIITAFATKVEEEGYRAGVYSNISWIKKHLNWNDLSQYDLWLAQYSDTPSTDYKFNMWQYTESGTVPGIESECDLNVRIQ